MIFETTDLDNRGVPLKGWDGMMAGSPAPQGTYVWKINAWFIDGTEWKGMRYKAGDTPSQTGILHLIR